MSEPKGPTISDAELLALAAVAQVEAVLMAGDNWTRQNQGYCPMWSDGSGYMEATNKLRDELYHRGILK